MNSHAGLQILCRRLSSTYLCCAVPCHAMLCCGVFRDRMSVPRGPCPLHVLKDCWVQGVVDENTLVWGQVGGVVW